MPQIDPTQLVSLAAALIALRGDTLRSTAAATGIRPANLSVWLRGKEQVISQKRVVSMLHHLGVSGAQLRSDMVHLWSDSGALASLQRVMSTVHTCEAGVVLFQDHTAQLQKTYFLSMGDVLIRLHTEPGVGSSAQPAQAVKVAHVVHSDMPLTHIPTGSMKDCQEALAHIVRQVAQTSEDAQIKQLLLGLEQRFNAQTSPLQAPSPGWDELQTALKAALQAGFLPRDIAQILRVHCTK